MHPIDEMNSRRSGLNPYQPPPATLSETDSAATTQATFQLNRRLRRHAEEQYLLHWHPNLLLFSSLGMIGVSCGAIVVAVEFKVANLVPTLICVMAISAAIYSALVQRSTRRIRAQAAAHGLDGAGGRCDDLRRRTDYGDDIDGYLQLA